MAVLVDHSRREHTLLEIAVADQFAIEATVARMVDFFEKDSIHFRIYFSALAAVVHSDFGLWFRTGSARHSRHSHSGGIEKVSAQMLHDKILIWLYWVKII